MERDSLNCAKLSIKVYPNAPKDEIVGWVDGILKVKVAAHPIRGKANKQLIEFLSHVLGLRKGCISILRGETDPHKIVVIEGLAQAEVIKRLIPGAKNR